MKVYSEQDRQFGIGIVVIIFALLCFSVGCVEADPDQIKSDTLNKYVADLPIGATNVKILDNPSSSYPHKKWVKFTLDDRDILLMQEGYGDSKVVSMVVLR